MDFSAFEEYLITRTKGNIDEIKAIIEHLASVDWEQCLNSQKQLQIDDALSSYTYFHAQLQQGYEACHECKEMFERLYAWPYPEITWTPSLTLDEKRMPSSLLRRTRNHLRYCKRCYIKAFRDFDEYMQNNYFPYTYLTTCDLCERRVPIKALYHLYLQADTRRDFCLHCISTMISRQFIQCQGCSKFTTHFKPTHWGLCLDCHTLYGMHRKSVARHLIRAQKVGALHSLTVQEWGTTVQHFQQMCAYCRLKPYVVLEHFLSLKWGGGTTVDNCVPACDSCNTRKSDARPDQLDRLFPPSHIEQIREYLAKPNAPINLAVNRALIVV